MYRIEGRGATIAATRDALDGLVDLVEDTHRPAVWVYRPHRQVAFGPRDVNHEGYGAAADEARGRGFAVVERSVGGHPVAHTGATLVFLRAVPIDDPRGGLTDRYDTVLEAISGALEALGVSATRGEPPAAFCPGDHSLSADGKLVGLAQRVTQSVAVVSGVAIVAGADDVADVLEAVYGHLDLPFDPASVGSIAAGGGPADTDTVARAVERALIGDEPYEDRAVECLIERA